MLNRLLANVISELDEDIDGVPIDIETCSNEEASSEASQSTRDRQTGAGEDQNEPIRVVTLTRRSSAETSNSREPRFRWLRETRPPRTGSEYPSRQRRMPFTTLGEISFMRGISMTPPPPPEANVIFTFDEITTESEELRGVPEEDLDGRRTPPIFQSSDSVPPPPDSATSTTTAPSESGEQVVTPESIQSTSTTGEGSSSRNSQSTSYDTNATEEIPEGVDPSFLEALPPEMRREVLEQHRMLRLQQRISLSSSSDQAVAGGSSEVSPEFLAALPPSLQEEVLTQQRLEQQRQAAARANPDEPVDAASFFETLQPSLRTMILSDMEDSQMSVLPPDLAAEAQTLRRDWEARNRQMVQERFLQSNLTTIIRHSTRGRIGSRFNSHLFPQRSQWGAWARDFASSSNSSAATANTAPNANPNVKIKGRQLLDHESLSCLLVLLFVDDPKLNTGRLHRVIRNLCYHVPTRDWVVKALLSIIEKSVYVKTDDTLNKPKRPKPGPLCSKLVTDARTIGNGANWLNIRLEAALGCHASVFIVNRATGKRNDKSNPSTISIHPQAAPVVAKNALDLFTSLAKSFPTFLLPLKTKDKNKQQSTSRYRNENTDFWEMLLKLDASSTKKGKSLAKTHSNLNLSSDAENVTVNFDQSPFGQLISMLSSPVIKSSITLTDKLLRLLSVISLGMPELARSSTNKNTSQTSLETVNAPESALNLAVNVLTHKSCSEEGLEEVTTLLLNLANCSLLMSKMVSRCYLSFPHFFFYLRTILFFQILNLLLTGALRIGEIVRGQIFDMLEELQSLHRNQAYRTKPSEEPSTSSGKGVLCNRFTNENIVITASAKVKTSCDLQLPAMAPLTSKTSSQVFFLRVLRVIVQIRDAIKKTLEKS